MTDTDDAARLEEIRARDEAAINPIHELIEWCHRKPNRQYAYNECRYCGQTWWDGEYHHGNCIVPNARREFHRSDIPWLLDQIAARDARIAELERARAPREFPKEAPGPWTKGTGDDIIRDASGAMIAETFGSEAVCSFILAAVNAAGAVHEAERRVVAPIVCFCGSSRFVAEMAVLMWEFEKAGKIALGLHLLPREYCGDVNDHMAEHQDVAAAMDDLHRKKIDLADSVYVVNPDGYIGDSTAREIIYARSVGKPIDSLEPIDEACAALESARKEAKEGGA